MNRAPLLKLGLVIGVLFVVLIFVTGTLHWRAPLTSVEQSGIGTTTTAITGKKLTIHTTDGIERWYTNKELKFSFRLPDGFMAPEGKTDVPNTHAVVVQNDAGNKLLIIVLPIASGTKLVEEDIGANLPGVEVSNMREGFVGSVIRGFSFSSDTKEWGGEGVHFWFAYNGYLYQLSTTLEDAALLDFVLSTWRFDHPTPSKPR